MSVTFNQITSVSKTVQTIVLCRKIVWNALIAHPLRRSRGDARGRPRGRHELQTEPDRLDLPQQGHRIIQPLARRVSMSPVPRWSFEALTCPLFSEWHWPALFGHSQLCLVFDLNHGTAPMDGAYVPGAGERKCRIPQPIVVVRPDIQEKQVGDRVL